MANAVELSQLPERLYPQDDSPSPKAFARQRKLTLPVLFVFLLSLVASGKNQGVDGKSEAFFRQARRSGLCPDAEAVHRSAVTKARAKLPWTAFEQVHHQAVRLAYELWPESADYTWQGLSVFIQQHCTGPPRGDGLSSRTLACDRCRG